MSKKRILIADDSPTMIMLLKDILTSNGYEVIIAKDGIEASILSHKEIPDLIISDIEMPKMDGYQVCRLLKNDDEMKKIPFIILTSKEGAGAEFWGYQTGADLYLLKNFEEKDLIDSINQLLEKYSDIKPDKSKIQNKITYDHIMQKTNKFLDNQLFEMTLINEINKISTKQASISDTLNEIIEVLKKTIDFQILSFSIITDEDKILLQLYQRSNIEEETLQLFEFNCLEDLSISLNKDISEYEIEVEIIEDKNIKKHKTINNYNKDNLYSLQLKTDNEIIGLMHIYNENINKIPTEQKILLSKLSNHISSALNASILYNKIKELSVIDGLTQIYNRRYVMEIFKIEVEKSLRYNRALSIIMLDIDDFKKVNDTYGHLTGDIVLKKIAEICKKAIRNVDIPGRYGGEEFIIILPETEKDSSVKIAERIRKGVMETRFKSLINQDITITVSLGVSCISELDIKENELELVKLADKRLYKAKSTGKNKVVYE